MTTEGRLKARTRRLLDSDRRRRLSPTTEYLVADDEQIDAGGFFFFSFSFLAATAAAAEAAAEAAFSKTPAPPQPSPVISTPPLPEMSLESVGECVIGGTGAGRLGGRAGFC